VTNPNWMTDVCVQRRAPVSTVVSQLIDTFAVALTGVW
jgi:uncharacterized PurR-regulated membrane protein YhhQ (DUF165 family)